MKTLVDASNALKRLARHGSPEGKQAEVVAEALLDLDARLKVIEMVTSSLAKRSGLTAVSVIADHPSRASQASAVRRLLAGAAPKP